MTSVPILQLKSISKSYSHGIKALHNVSFSVSEQEFVYIMGRSGAGKTTLFRIITKQEEPDEGEVWIENERISSIPQKKKHLVRRKIGVVFQDFNLIDYKTVFANVAFALELRGLSKKYIQKQVEMALEIVGLSQRTQNYPQMLSGGEQQRVAIARAIVTKPKILLADEPTGNLDYKTSESIMGLFSKINQMGTSIVMATHDLDIVSGTGRRIIILDHGEKMGENCG
ncbi:MAG: cell division ATP-binding protein FtsE [Caldisericia bacterium]|nr:cell division ATP-binding protein FtsE [Caldisericia bacterium]MDD4614273.1 cell division ATP-binding protein FtsE [Caldisericia bacterium]